MSGRARLLIAATLVGVVGIGACGGSDEEETTPVAKRFVEAVNSGSTDRVLATLSRDAVVVDSGRRFADRQAIRAWLDAEVTGVEGRITVQDDEPSANGTVLTVDFESSGFRGTDLRYAFVIGRDRISRLTLGG
jgi:hypothetical protein